MPEPYEFVVVQALQTTLAAISVAGGYYFDVAGTAVKLDPNAHAEAMAAPDGLRPFIVIQVNPDQWEFSPARVVALTMSVRLHWFNDTDPTDDSSKLQTYFRGLADMEMAVEKAARTGSLPSATRVTGRSMAAESVGTSRLWMFMDLSIHLNRRYGAPLGN